MNKLKKFGKIAISRIYSIKNILIIAIFHFFKLNIVVGICGSEESIVYNL